MTPRFKDFGAGGLVSVEPLSFKLYDEEFNCRSAIQGKVLLDMVSKGSSGLPGDSISVLTDFFNKALLDESLVRFNALIEDPDRIVSLETLTDIVSWMTSEYASRPIVGSDNSQSGQ